MKVAWERCIRFIATDGRTLRGEPIMPSPDFDLGLVTRDTKLKVRVIEGDDLYDAAKTTVTEEIVILETLLGPLTPKDVPILRCVGLNYAKHSEHDLSSMDHHSGSCIPTDQTFYGAIVREAGRSPPPFPFIFFKPSLTVHDHGAPVVIPKICQDDQADYEGELCIVIGRDAKDVSEAEALDYVAAYTAGNDISSRKLQRDPAFAGKVPQWGFSKGFDTFAPLGPCLVASRLIENPDDLLLTTTVDGEQRQCESTADLLFGCKYLISYLSQGTTLEKGSVIMTGTPGGVGSGLNPPRHLVPGTQMDVKIAQIGTLKNGVVFS